MTHDINSEFYLRFDSMCVDLIFTVDWALAVKNQLVICKQTEPRMKKVSTGYLFRAPNLLSFEGVPSQNVRE